MSSLGKEEQTETHSRKTVRKQDDSPINAKEYLKKMRHASIDYSNLDTVDEISKGKP